MKTAFLFPVQGSRRADMGSRAVKDSFTASEASEAYREATG